MTGRRQPGLFDEYDPPGDPAPLALDPAAAFEFYRRAVGDPALHRSRVYPEFARGPLPAPAAADWLTLAAVLLGDRPATRPTRERVTVVVSSSRVGAIIGKKGEKIEKRIETKEGVFDQSQVTPEVLKARQY